MTTARLHPLPAPARALLAITAAHWGLAPRGSASVRRRPTPAAGTAAHQPWPYSPADPGAAVGWR